MSGPKPLRLSPAAQRDLTAILRYTGETWGRAQLLTYRDKLNEALLLLADNPELGHRGAALSSSHRQFSVGSHVIVYRERVHATEIVRILHQRMSLGPNVESRAARA